MKTCRKFVFHPRETHISSIFDIKVLYMIFLVFSKYQVSLQNPRGVAFSFIEKHLFTMKICRKSVFHHCEAHIIFCLDISVL
jgi:hypothetical protein